MKTVKLVWLFVAAAFHLAAAGEPPPRFHHPDSPIWNEIQKADVDLHYALHKQSYVQRPRWDAEKGEFVGERVEIEKADLGKFLGKHEPDFAVVTIAKNRLPDDELARLVADIANVFHKLGVNRVMILGANGGGVIEHGDFDAPAQAEPK